MRYYPLFLDLQARRCLVIGGGTVAERKVLSLLEAGARVAVVSPSATPRLRELAGEGKIELQQRVVQDQDLEGAALVFAATDSPEVNASSAALCRAKNIPVNVASPPEESTFIVPSAVARGELLIAVSTSGASPALSRKIRKELEERYGPEYGAFLELLGKLRKELPGQVRNEQERRRIYDAVVESDVLELLRQGRTEDAEKRLRKITGLKN
ncbi:MAG: hypothetical protein A2X56_13475 [Nitrospirae bacterium GWC2_57_13]|jgi:precorrin-2 dehydrogenase / sirohydrochlorin ferrochelatase|nr:MAG: hypothetical protein A2072_04655 [Nitrospirae bacterium GWC1_57_7]OGW29382.1 MAG: hypothetical protein A2X56_13475 [Nitrospirae bacterium GWC2_57_13]OGW41230.1 MAG: hypothetical protein A2X57_12035 [Nitrospirae bacterium GWD2_57_8]HAR46868.1 siroheme synthase [Nitrospiraceae bacterium]